MKKIILTIFAVASLFLYNSQTYAFSVSVGIPMSQTITGKQSGRSYGNAPDTTRGYFNGVHLITVVINC